MSVKRRTLNASNNSSDQSRSWWLVQPWNRQIFYRSYSSLLLQQTRCQVLFNCIRDLKAPVESFLNLSWPVCAQSQNHANKGKFMMEFHLPLNWQPWSRYHNRPSACVNYILLCFPLFEKQALAWWPFKVRGVVNNRKLRGRSREHTWLGSIFSCVRIPEGWCKHCVYNTRSALCTNGNYFG